MKIAVGAPVAEREWVLPKWMQCLEQQTVQPNYFCFVYSKSEDGTLDFIENQCCAPSLVHKSHLPFYSRNQRQQDPKDKHRAEHLSRLRNQLRTMLLSTDADLFLSLDTDILLEDPTIIEQLVHTQQQGWDVVQPTTYLHPWGAKSLCYNAGWLGGMDIGLYTQDWQRATQNEVMAYRSPIQIDIPMAVYLMRRHVAGMCAYKAHECGEDIGFGQNLAKHHYKVGWRTDLETQHVWGPDYLVSALAAPEEELVQ